MIDADKRLARLEIGKDDDGNPVLGPWAQWEEAAVGSLSIHTPLKIGQQASYASPSGVLGDGSTIRARGYDDDNAAPSKATDAAVLAFGGVTITMSAGGVAIHGNVTVTAASPPRAATSPTKVRTSARPTSMAKWSRR